MNDKEYYVTLTLAPTRTRNYEKQFRVAQSLDEKLPIGFTTNYPSRTLYMTEADAKKLKSQTEAILRRSQNLFHGGTVTRVEVFEKKHDNVIGNDIVSTKTEKTHESKNERV